MENVAYVKKWPVDRYAAYLNVSYYCLKELTLSDLKKSGRVEDGLSAAGTTSTREKNHK